MNLLNKRLVFSVALAWLVGVVAFGQPRARGPRGGGDASLAQPYRGITSGGTIESGLFKIESTGVSTEPVAKAAHAFLAGLNDEQRKRTTFPVDDSEWRKWDNRHFYKRQGVGFDEMDSKQRELAFGLMRASLSAKGLKKSKDITKLSCLARKMATTLWPRLTRITSISTTPVYRDRS